MSSIPLPALGVRPPQQEEDPVTKFVRLKSMLGQQKLQQQQVQENELQLKQREQSMADQQTVQQALAQTNGDLERAAKLTYGKVSPQMTFALQKAHRDAQKEVNDLDAAERAKRLDQGDRLSALIQQAKAMPPDQYAASYPQIAAAAKAIRPELNIPDQPIPQQALDGLQMGLVVSKNYLEQQKEQREAALFPAQKAEAETKVSNLKRFGSATPSDVDKYIADYLAANNLPDTPANRQIAHQAKTKEEKIVPAQIRVEGFGDIRGMPVTDTKLGITVPMSWNDYNKASKAEPGRYTSPQYDAQTQMGIKAWRDLAPSGAVGKQVTSYDTFLRHTGDLYDAVSSLQNTNFPYMNKGINWLRTQTGDPRVKTFLAKLDPVKKEFESFLLNNRALYEDDRKDAQKIIDENASPAQMLSVLPSLAHTAQARMGATNETFRRATGEDIPNLISPEAQAVIQKVGGAKKSSAKLGDIKNYQGHDYVFDGTQWVLR